MGIDETHDGKQMTMASWHLDQLALCRSIESQKMSVNQCFFGGEFDILFCTVNVLRVQWPTYRKE